MKYIEEAFTQNWIAPLGPNVDAFEKVLAEYCAVEHAAALSSDTTAIHLALIMLGAKAGDEVIASSFTFSASINPIVYLGATPILIDSEAHTWNMDPALLEKAIRDRLKKGKRPKAIIPVHLYGMPANMSEIMEIAKRYEIPVIEDAAEALGSRFRDRPLDSFGKAGVLSFNGNKILSTQARDQAPYYQHSAIGYNYRMSNILAGIGRGQMEVLEERVSQRRVNFHFYKEHLAEYDFISFLEEESDSFFSNHWLTTLLIDPAKTDLKWQTVFHELEKDQIETRPLWKPMHLQPVFKSVPAYINGCSERLFSLGLCLPSGSNLTDSDRKELWVSYALFLTILLHSKQRNTYKQWS